MIRQNEEMYAPDFWEEHCIECGAPACYGTCEKYVRAPGGVCRRFTHGIERISGGGFAVSFLPWGKLELFWQGRMVRASALKKLQRFYRCAAGIFRFFLGEGVVRGLCRRITCRIGDTSHAPTRWVIKCCAEAEEELIASVANRNGEELWVRRLTLAQGENQFLLGLPKIPSRSFFRLSSLNGTLGRVTFLKCDLMSSRDPNYVKCVAWDLDNTLWDGILANDGAENVRLRQNVVETIKVLDQRGILNTVCSKNDYDLAWKTLKEFGLSEYFVFPSINWNPKSENLRKQAKDINIGLDTFAFVDDSAHERGEVADNIPEVRVFDERDVAGLLTRPEFNPPASAESALRRQSYLAEMARRHDEVADVGSHEDFIRKCEIELLCECVQCEEVKRRCWELVNRTNQLTLAAHRYTELDFERLVESGLNWAIRCRDKYGDYGIVGFVHVDIEDTIAKIGEFVMSCRVAKKYCEQSVLLSLADRFREEGRLQLLANVVQTGRNGALIQAFDAMPFTCTETDGRRFYSLGLKKLHWENCFRNACAVL